VTDRTACGLVGEARELVTVHQPLPLLTSRCRHRDPPCVFLGVIQYFFNQGCSRKLVFVSLAFSTQRLRAVARFLPQMFSVNHHNCPLPPMLSVNHHTSPLPQMFSVNHHNCPLPPILSVNHHACPLPQSLFVVCCLDNPWHEFCLGWGANEGLCARKLTVLSSLSFPTLKHIIALPKQAGRLHVGDLHRVFNFVFNFNASPRRLVLAFA
jgi:hypothetical protein